MMPKVIETDKRYPCQECGKSYLSANALYTHCKVKHPLFQKPTGNETAVFKPKFTTPHSTIKQPKKLVLHDTELSTAKSSQFFDVAGRWGGPTLPTFGFDKAFEIIIVKTGGTGKFNTIFWLSFGLIISRNGKGMQNTQGAMRHKNTVIIRFIRIYLIFIRYFVKSLIILKNI